MPIPVFLTNKIYNTRLTIIRAGHGLQINSTIIRLGGEIGLYYLSKRYNTEIGIIMENINVAKARFLEIKEAAKKLNIETGVLLLKIKEEDHAEGWGPC